MTFPLSKQPITPSKGRGFALLEVIIAVSILGLVLAGSAKIAMDNLAKKELAKVGEQVAALIIAVDKRVYLDKQQWQPGLYRYDDFAWLKHDDCASGKDIGLPNTGELNKAHWPEAPLKCGFKSYFGRGYEAYSAEGNSGMLGSTTFIVELDTNRDMELSIEVKRPHISTDNYMMEAGRIGIGIEDALRSHGFYLENLTLRVGPVGKDEIKAFLSNPKAPLEIKIELNGARYLKSDGSVAMEQDSRFCWKDGDSRSCMKFTDKTLSLESLDGTENLSLKAKDLISKNSDNKFVTVPQITEVMGGELVAKPNCPTGYFPKISLVPSTVSDRNHNGINWGDDKNRDPAIQQATLTAGWTLGWKTDKTPNGQPAWRTIITIGSKEFKDGFDNPKGFRAVAFTWCAQP